MARQFDIRPRPELIAGAHDGEITFELPPGEFVIKLRAADPNSRSGGPPGPRMRLPTLTSFVQSGEKWERALNVVTNNLGVADRPDVFDFVTERLQAGRPVSSPVAIELRSRAPKGAVVLEGRWRIIGSESILIWGQLTQGLSDPRH